MMTQLHATGTIEQETWDFQTVEEQPDGRKLVRMSATDLFHGEIEGEARAEFVALLKADASSALAGMYRVSGSVGGREGTFTLQTVGSSDAGGTSRGTWSVVPGSGTASLTGIRGDGAFRFVRGGESFLSLDYSFD
jgi:hypothetical protein